MISKKMIQEDKINVIEVLRSYLKATDSEIQQFTKRIEDDKIFSLPKVSDII